MKVIALVGTSGTGKSYKAMSLAHEMDIKYIIDDGLLIKGSRKLAGSSAKAEKTKISAVKKAIFFFDDHRQEVAGKIKEENPESILLLGTSIKMVETIARNLELNKIDEIVMIEDISTAEEIQTARYHRMTHGKHVIPLPTLELKKDFSGHVLDTLKIFWKRRGSNVKVLEKTVVRPTFSFLGRYTISDKTLIQIVTHVAECVEGISAVSKVKIIENKKGIRVDVDVHVTYGSHITNVAEEVQKQVKTNLEHMTHLNVLHVNIYVKMLIKKN